MRRLTLEQMVDIDEIRRLKAQYARFLDEQDWAALLSVFTDDCVFARTDADGCPVEIVGPEVIVGSLRDAIRGRRTCHHCSAPEITFTGEGAAEGIWAAMYVQQGGHRGYGYYRDRYRRVDGRWLLQRSQFDPLWVEPASVPS